MTSRDQTVERHENDAEAARRRLSNSLDELTLKLTPGGVLDEVLTYARAGGGDFMKALGRSAAANPVPAILIGVGCAMFLTGRGRVGWGTDRAGADRDAGGWWKAGEGYGEQAAPGQRSISRGSGAGRLASAAGSAVSSAAGAVRDGAEAAASTVADQARAGANVVGSAASGLVEKAGQGASAVSDAASAAVGRVAETARDAAETAADYAGSVGGTVAERGRRAAAQADALRRNVGDATATLVREQPLLVAAGGLVIGAAIAALFPRTALEDSVMGEASDAVKNTVGEVASGTLDSATSAVERVAGEVGAAAEAEGLTPGKAAENLKTLGDKMAKVATAGADAAREETEKAFRPAG
jgi:hypothetical protein